MLEEVVASLSSAFAARDEISQKKKQEVSEEERWDRLYRTGRTPWNTEAPASQLVAYARRYPVEGLRCVELCCGTGASCVFLAQEGASRVVGYDVSGVAVSRARERAKRAGVEGRCSFERVDVTTNFFFENFGNLPPHLQFDLAFDCQGFEILCSRDSERAGDVAARLVRDGGRFLTIAGNAHEFRNYDGGATSLSVPELVGALCPPFSLLSLAETRFDGGEFVSSASKEDDDDLATTTDQDRKDDVVLSRPRTRVVPDDDDDDEHIQKMAPLAWRALFVKKHGGSATTSDHSPTSSRSSTMRRKQVVDDEEHRQHQEKNSDKSTSTSRSEKPPEIFARQLTTAVVQTFDHSDAVDAALSVDGSVAPSDHGSDALLAADGFENIALSRERAARQERARLEGDVPWVKFWEKRAGAYDALVSAQPVLFRLAARVARAALVYASSCSSDTSSCWSLQELDDELPQRQQQQRATTTTTTRVLFRKNPPHFHFLKQQQLVAVDLAAGFGACALALADALAELSPEGRWSLRVDLVEPAHSMAALARARLAKLRARHPRSQGCVYQIPVERCHERLSSRRHAAVDVVTCSAAIDCLNYYDVLEAAAALLRPGGALAFDLSADSYEETSDDVSDVDGAWVPCVLAALRDRGVEATTEDVLSHTGPSKARRSPLSASAIAAAANAAGLRLACCDVAKDQVPCDFFIAHKAISTSWLSEPFSDMPRSDAKHLRNVVVLDAAKRAAHSTTVLTTVVVVVVKPPDASSSLGRSEPDQPFGGLSGSGGERNNGAAMWAREHPRVGHASDGGSTTGRVDLKDDHFQ
mmetsp:Transcript_2637/g.7925  ORF Transcript_2637/g.7925 Transcript_2637/m.7925 type:complete len:814 (+) Transcript_2637:955-3396(+)